LPSNSVKTHRETFTKKERIAKRAEFIKRHPEDVVMHTHAYQFVFKPSTNTFSRLGIVVTKRDGKAVFRNRVKRVLREAFRKNKSMIQPPRDVIAIRKHHPAYPTLRETEKHLTDAVKQFVRVQRHKGTDFSA